jgi:hypothetical protein
MTSPRKPSDEEIVRALHEELADDAAAERANAMTEEELDAKLAAAGVDLDEANARLDALLVPRGDGKPAPVRDAPKAAESGQSLDDAPAPAEAKPAEVVPIRGGPRKGGGASRFATVTAWAAAAMVALGIGRIVQRQLSSGPDHGDIVADKDDSPILRARAERNEAAQACDEARLDDCRTKLDDARQLDPAGENDPVVKGLRARLVVPDAAAPQAQDQSARPRPRAVEAEAGPLPADAAANKPVDHVKNVRPPLASPEAGEPETNDKAPRRHPAGGEGQPREEKAAARPRPRASRF